MAFNFGQARLAERDGFGGETILRFDDTNPEAEDQEYIDAILHDVAWLGHQPVKVTYTSDYFKDMYLLALQLIDQGQAYVCHSSREQVQRQRAVTRHARQNALPTPDEAYSPDRDTSPEENRRKFEAMRDGEYREGGACLRMKGDLESDNPAMWDPVFYRVKNQPHPRTGHGWRIYPSYDFSHCIVDSVEGITHSCCTLEFGSRQAPDGPYYWLLDALGLYKPVTWEYSRCSIVGSVLSKRKLQQLVMGRHVEGWDDPRLLTIAGLRRRGYSAATVNKFCEQIGVTAAMSVSTHLHVLEAVAREELDASAPRVFAVIRPLSVVITNRDDIAQYGELEHINDDDQAPVVGYMRVRHHPKNESMGTRLVPFGTELLIQRSDWRDSAEPDFFGLTPAGSVGLVGTKLVLHCDSVEPGPSEGLRELRCHVESRSSGPRPKGNVHWVAKQHALPIRVRKFGPLLLPEDETAPSDAANTSRRPSSEAETNLQDDEVVATDESWLRGLNPHSMHEEHDAVLEAGAGSMTQPVQFMREGFYVRDCKDLDQGGPPLFHEIVPLKSSYPG